jgi:tight adherence protein C
MSNSTVHVIAIMCSAIAVTTFVLFMNALRLDHFLKKNNTDSGHNPRQSDTHQIQDTNSPVEHHFLIRLCWPLINVLSLCVLPFMTWGVRQKLSRSLSQAGLHGWSCSQFLALQLLFAGLVALLCFISFLMFLSYDKNNFLILSLLCSVTAGIYPRVWLLSKKRQRYQEIERGLPFFLDMVTLGLEAGMNLQTAIQLSLDHLNNGPLKDEWLKTIFEIRSGVLRSDAFRNMSQRVDLVCIRQMMTAFIQGESMGLSLTRSIGEFSRQQGQLRLFKAEKIALQAPVKMLFPLALCIFPCTFLVLGFPVVAQLLGLET